MIELQPLSALVAAEDRVADIVAPQYDSLAHGGRFQYATDRPDSFLNVVLSRADFPPPAPPGEEVVERAVAHFAGMLARGLFEEHPAAAFFVYELSTNSHTQTGLVAGVPVSAVHDGAVVGHEGVIRERASDLAEFYQTARLTSSPVSLAFAAEDTHRGLFAELRASPPIRDFTSWDGIRQRLWAVDRPGDIARVQSIMGGVETFYVTDGHHRVAAAKMMGDDPDWFLGVLFPADEMHVLEYNRCVALATPLNVSELAASVAADWSFEYFSPAGAAHPQLGRPGEFAMLAGGHWHLLRFVGNRPTDLVRRLDVCLLHDRLLKPAFGIEDDQDPRLSFVVGEDASSRLEEIVRSEPSTVAYALRPTSVGELFEVADAGELMPAKSTWFTPKPRSGLLVVRW